MLEQPNATALDDPMQCCGGCQQPMMIGNLAMNMKGLWKSRDRSPDGHVRDGEWPEATPPPFPRIAGLH